MDVAVPVADWNDDVHVVYLWMRRYKDIKARNLTAKAGLLACTELTELHGNNYLVSVCDILPLPQTC